MKCDLHVHTLHSGMCTVPLANAFCRESYNRPEAVYARLKSLGMDLVTITDHDSIDASESLRHHPDFFLSEEATCRMPSGTSVHIGIYDIDESQHIQIQRRRNDFHSLMAYLGEQNLLFSVNHLLSSLTGARDFSDYEWFERSFPCFETLNGAMLKKANEGAADLALRLGKAPIGGSDAHSMSSVGCAYTRVAGASTKREFLEGIRRGDGLVTGESGNCWKLTRDVLLICREMMAEHKWTALFSPLLMGLPAVIAVNYWLELAFASKWMNRVTVSGSLPLSGAAWKAREASA